MTFDEEMAFAGGGRLYGIDATTFSMWRGTAYVRQRVKRGKGQRRSRRNAHTAGIRKADPTVRDLVRDLVVFQRAGFSRRTFESLYFPPEN